MKLIEFTVTFSASPSLSEAEADAGVQELTHSLQLIIQDVAFAVANRVGFTILAKCEEK